MEGMNMTKKVKISKKNLEQAFSKKIFEQTLLKVLRDNKTVRKEIIEICNDNIRNSVSENTKYKNLSVEYEKLKKECSNQASLIESLKSENSKLRNDSNSKINELENKLTLLEAEKSKLLDDYNCKVNDLENKHILLEKEYDKKTEELNDEKTKHKQNNEKIRKLETENSKVKKDITSLQEEISRWNDMYDSLISTYEIYCSLPENIKNELNGILHYDSPELFFARAGKSDFVERFWNYISRKIIKDYNNSTEHSMFDSLIELFDRLFDVFNASELNPRFRRCEVYIDDEFDSSQHDKINTVAQGKICEVISPGYTDVKGNILGKSLVIVK